MVLVQRGESTVGFDPGKLSGLRVGSVPHEAHRRDRALSLAMIRRLQKSLNIPAEVLIRPVRRRKRPS